MVAMQSDTDSEDDEQMRRQFLEAADHTLLTSDLYQKLNSEQQENISEAVPTQRVATSCAANEEPKSQRYLAEDCNIENASDLKFSSEIKTHFWRKLSALINEQVEYVSAPPLAAEACKSTRRKSKVRLLADSGCFVKAYDEIRETCKGPQKKPEICRRQLPELFTGDVALELQALAVSGADVLSGRDVNYWSIRPTRPGKMFAYRADRNGKLHAQEAQNEFTAQRLKRKWNESKIRQNIKSK